MYCQDSVSTAAGTSGNGIRKYLPSRKSASFVKDSLLMWLGHIHCMDNVRLAKHAMDWMLADFNRKPEIQRKNWKSIIQEDHIIIID